MDVAKTLEKRRAERGISYSELSRRASVNVDMMARFCKGQAIPKADQLIRICKELDLDVDDFVDDE